MTQAGLSKNLRSALALPLERKAWLLAFLLGMPLAWIGVRVLPMRRLLPLVGAPLENRRVSVLATRTQWRKARSMGKLMHAMGERMLPSSRCLVEALCVKWMLNRYDIPAVFYLGARLDKEKKEGMRAHAWVRVGPVAVVGGPSEREYPIVATFTTPPLGEEQAAVVRPRERSAAPRCAGLGGHGLS